MSEGRNWFDQLYPWLIILFVLVVPMIIIGTTLCRDLRAGTLSKGFVALAFAPALINLVLIYSLAIHMRYSLGYWPDFGENGFPPALLTHVHVAERSFICLILATTFAWPIAYALTLLIRSWRRWSVYLDLYFLACLFSVGAVLLAPAPFLDWLMD